MVVALTEAPGAAALVEASRVATSVEVHLAASQEVVLLVDTLVEAPTVATLAELLGA